MWFYWKPNLSLTYVLVDEVPVPVFEVPFPDLEKAGVDVAVVVDLFVPHLEKAAGVMGAPPVVLEKTVLVDEVPVPVFEVLELI